jgi:hypothetical protein
MTNCQPNATSQMTVLQGISYATAKKKKGMTVGFVTFESIEQLKNAVQVIICFFILPCLGFFISDLDFCLSI